jgi:hypothetical protein
MSFVAIDLVGIVEIRLIFKHLGRITHKSNFRVIFKKEY